MNDMTNTTDTNLTETQLYNRLDEITILSNLLKSTEFNSPPTLLVLGKRGVGKTTVLKEIKNKFDKDFLVVNIDISKSNAYQQKNLTRNTAIKLIYESIIASCEEYSKTLEIDEILPKEDNLMSLFENEDYYPTLADFTMKLPQKIYEENSDKLKGVFIFLDEIQLMKDIDYVDKFFWYMRSIIQTQNNVAYLFCGSMGMKDSIINDLNGRHGAFGGRMLTYEIPTFTKQTTKEYIESLPRNIQLEDNAFERFYECTQGLPYYINIFAKILPENITLTENNITELFNESIDYLAVYFIYKWFKITFQEQKIIIALLENPKKRIEIANTLDVTSGSLNRPLNRLLDFDLIEYENDRYKITDQIFTQWLNNTYEKNGVYPFRSI